MRVKPQENECPDCGHLLPISVWADHEAQLDLELYGAQVLQLQVVEAHAALRLCVDALIAVRGWVPYSQGFAETDAVKYTEALAAAGKALGP